MYTNYNECKFCGKRTKYELCNECYHMAKEEIIIKNDQEKWVKNVKKGNEFKFYDENKDYVLKKDILNEYEKRFYNVSSYSLSRKYIIIPQVNLQTIIETDSNRRNDELYRNIDFVVFKTKNYEPFLAIELNGQQHYTNEYWKERDKSVKAILDKVQLPLLTVDIKDLKNLEDKNIQTLIKKVIKYLNPSFFKALFGKKTNKMDLAWTKELICTQ